MKVLLPGGAVYWQGQADVNGCATVQLAPGSYQLLQYTDDVKAGSVTVSTYHVQNGVPYWYSLFTNFSVSGPASLHLFPTFNNDAVQAAAIAGQALAAHQFNGGMGFLPGTYRIHTNDGCTEFDPPTDSCYKDGIVHIGTTPANGYTDAHWKFIVGHELGHMVQDRAMGWISINYDDTASQALCRCDHYSTDWGNKTHCIQSRERIGAAQTEGFGHAFATRTFNYTQYNEATFVYYKPVMSGLIYFVQYPPVSFNGFDPANWMKNHCPAAGRGTERDWLTFYTNVASNSSPSATPFSALFNIYKIACGGSTSYSCAGQLISWTKLDNAAKTYYGSDVDPRYLRFRFTAIDHGVNY